MMNKRATLTAWMVCLFSTLGSLTLASTPPPPPPPPKVTVTDNFGSHGAYLRWEQFSTDLSASLANPPQSDQETTITGPTYSWAVVSQSPSSPTFNITDSGNGNATLQSPTPSKNICFVAGGGTYDVTVNCTITYTSTDNKTGAATPLSYYADPPLDVTFFVRVPYNVVKNGAKTNTLYYTPQNSLAGHLDVYLLQIMDNQPAPSGYGNGIPRETFTNGSQPSLNNGGAATWDLNIDGNGYDTGTASPSLNFSDNNGLYDRFADTDGGHTPQQFANSFNQPWHVMELTPPYNAPNANLYLAPGQFKLAPPNLNYPTAGDFLTNVNDTALNGGAGSTHQVINYYGYTQRLYPGQAAY